MDQRKITASDSHVKGRPRTSFEHTPLLHPSGTDTTGGPQTGAGERDAPSHVDYSKIFTAFIQRCFPCSNTGSSTPELVVSEEPSPIDIQQGSERSRQSVDAPEQRLWNSLKRDTPENFKPQMTEICNQETPEIVYRVKLFSHLDEKLRALKSRLADKVMEEVKNRLSEAKKSIMDKFIETKQELQTKQSEMFENKQYQFLKDKYDERDRMQDKLTKDKSELKNLQTELSKMQNINVDPAIGESSRDGRKKPHLASKIKWYPARIANLKQEIATLETEVQPLEQEIATLETEVQPFQTAYNKIKDEFNQLRTEVDKIRDEVEGEVKKTVEQDADIQKLKEERRNAQEKMLHAADNAKRQIRANAEQQYDHFLANRLRVLGEKLIGTPLSEEEQERSKLKTRELPINVLMAEKEHKVSEFIAFATALEDEDGSFTEMHRQGLEVIGRQFRDAHKQRLIDALDNTANSLKEALSSEDKQTLEMAIKVCQGEALSQDEKQTLKTTLIKTRQEEALSQDEKQALKIVQKIRQGEALSQDEKQALEDALMENLKRRSSTATPGRRVFIMGIQGAFQV